MALKTKILIAVAAFAVVGGIITAVILANSGGDMEDYIPAVVPVEIEADEPEEPPVEIPTEPECEHNWIEANFQQPQICTECGETQGEPLTPFFEENGFAVNMVLGETYPFRTRTFDNPDLTTIGEVTITDYKIVNSYEDHEPKEGYEWRIIQWLAVFSDDNHRAYGERFAPNPIDYYIGVDIEADYDTTNNRSFTTINFNGHEEEIQRERRVIRVEETGNGRVYEVEVAFLVPIGYDGIVYVFYNSVHDGDVSGILLGNVEHWTDIIDEDALLFRLGNVEQAVVDMPVITDPEPIVTTTTAPPAPVVTTTPAPVPTPTLTTEQIQLLDRLAEALSREDFAAAAAIIHENTTYQGILEVIRTQNDMILTRNNLLINGIGVAYLGDISDNQRHGTGAAITANDAHTYYYYTGSWRSNIPHGQGTAGHTVAVHDEGVQIYTGNVNNGFFDGAVIMEGHYRDNTRNICSVNGSSCRMHRIYVNGVMQELPITHEVTYLMPEMVIFQQCVDCDRHTTTPKSNIGSVSDYLQPFTL